MYLQKINQDLEKEEKVEVCLDAVKYDAETTPDVASAHYDSPHFSYFWVVGT